MASKLAPERNNVRWVIAKKKQKAAAATAPSTPASTADAADVLPTPLYNAGVLQDMLFAPHAAFLASSLRALPRLADGVLLLKTWARQRGLLGRADVFDGHALTMLMAHLAKLGKLVSPCLCAVLLPVCCIAVYCTAACVSKHHARSINACLTHSSTTLYCYVSGMH